MNSDAGAYTYVYKMPGWMKILIAADVVIVLLAAGLIIRGKKKRAAKIIVESGIVE